MDNQKDTVNTLEGGGASGRRNHSFSISLSEESQLPSSESDTHFQSIALIAFHYFQNQRSQDVKALAIPDILVPSGISQKDPLQYDPVPLSLLATVRTAACAVKILKQEGKQSFLK